MRQSRKPRPIYELGPHKFQYISPLRSGRPFSRPQGAAVNFAGLGLALVNRGRRDSAYPLISPAEIVCESNRFDCWLRLSRACAGAADLSSFLFTPTSSPRCLDPYDTPGRGGYAALPRKFRLLLLFNKRGDASLPGRAASQAVRRNLTPVC